LAGPESAVEKQNMKNYFSFYSCQKNNDYGTVVVGVKYNNKYIPNPDLLMG
jgi:hypothetical protein